jgi:hypothetical protein
MSIEQADWRCVARLAGERVTELAPFAVSVCELKSFHARKAGVCELMAEMYHQMKVVRHAADLDDYALFPADDAANVGVEIVSQPGSDERFPVFGAEDYITPIILATNTTYFIAADVPNSTSFISQLVGITTDPSITYDHGVNVFGSGNNPLTNSGGLAPGYLGPDFIIAGIAVPEPSSLVLATIAVAGVTISSLARRRKPRRA